MLQKVYPEDYIQCQMDLVTAESSVFYYFANHLYLKSKKRVEYAKTENTAEITLRETRGWEIQNASLQIRVLRDT